MAARTVVLIGRLVAARLHLQQPRHLVHVHVQQTGLRIERRSAPLRASIITGKDDRPRRTRRSEQSSCRELAEDRKRRVVRAWRACGELIFGERLPNERRRLHGQTLRRAGSLTIDQRRRHPVLRDRKERRAGFTIEQPHVSRLGRLRERVDGLSMTYHGDERRRRRKVHVPEVVPHALEMPDTLSRTRVEREDRVRKKIVAEPIGAIEIEGRGARASEDHAELVIHGQSGPDVGATRNLPRIGRPGRVAELARMRNGMKAPAQLTGLQIVRANVAW